MALGMQQMLQGFACVGAAQWLRV